MPIASANHRLITSKTCYGTASKSCQTPRNRGGIYPVVLMRDERHTMLCSISGLKNATVRTLRVSQTRASSCRGVVQSQNTEGRDHCSRRPKSRKREKDKWELFESNCAMSFPSFTRSTTLCEKRDNQALFDKPENPYEKFYR